MKINRKGFTLVELLVTIAICAIVILLMTYGIIGAVKNSKDKSIKISTNSIKEAANAYSLEQGEDAWKESSSYTFKALCVTVGELMNKGFLNENANISVKDVNKDTYVIVKKNKVTLAIEKEEIVYEDNTQNNAICTGNNIIDNETITKPSITGNEKYTDKIILSFQNGTAESGIKNYKCLYGETSSSINREGIVEGNKCILDNLKNNTRYYVYLYMNTIKGSSVTATGTNTYKTSDLKVPTTSQNLNVITINYNDKDSNNKAVNSPSHYIYSNISGVANKTVSKCTIERDKLNCVGTTTIIEKNTWYKVNEDNISVTYPEEDNKINIKARIYDKSNNYKETEKEYTIDKHTVKFYKNTALDIEGNKKDYITRSCITNGTGTCNVSSPNITPNIGYSVVGWNQSKTATTSTWNVNTTKAINSDLTYYAITRINKIYVKFNVNSGVVKQKTTASNGTVYNWTSNSSGTISRTSNGKTTSDIHVFEYGKMIGADGLANWDNNSYLYISRTGYIAVDGKEWKCLSGDCTANATYSDSENYQTSALCDASYRDCTATLGVNWTLKTYNFTITSGVGGSLKVENTTRNNSITVNSGETKTLKVYHFDKIKVTATPNKEYKLTSLKHGSTSMNSGSAFEVSGLETISATWADIVAPTIPTYKALYSDGSGNHTSGAWTNKGVYTTISSKDEGSGVTKIQYSKDNQKTWSTLNLGGKGILKNGITYSGNESWTVYDGRNDTIYFRACDAFDNCSASSNAFVIKYDTSAPSTPSYKAYFKDGSGTYISGSWTNKDVYTDISSTDSYSGVSYIEYSKDKTSWTKFKFAISGGLKANGTTSAGTESWGKTSGRNDTFYFRACDKVGNCSGISNAYNIKYDIAAPSVPTLTTIYDIWGSQSYSVSKGYSKDYGTEGTWVTSTNDPYIQFNNLQSFTGIKGAYIEFASALNSDLSIQIFYETSTAGYNETHSTRATLAKGATKLYIPFTHTGNWTKVRFDIGSASGISYKIKSLGVAANADQWNRDDILLHGITTEIHSGINNWQFTFSSSANSVGSDSSSTWVKYSGSATTEFITNTNRFSSERNQYTYIRTCDNVGNCSSKAKTYIKIDKTVPSKAEIVIKSETNLTLNYADNFGVVGYYFGKDNPNTSNVTYSPIASKTSGSIKQTISSAGIYYFSVKDAAGNVKTSSITSNTLTINPNGGTYNGKTSNSTFVGVNRSSKNVGTSTPPSGYTVTFNANGGSTTSSSITSTKSFSKWVLTGGGEYNNDTKVYVFGSSDGTLTANYTNNSITLPNATRTGYTFNGWYTAATGGTKIGNAGAKYTPTANTTLYAQWTANKYTVTLNNQGATSAGTTSVTATYDSAMPSITKPSKTGHTFNGYYTDKNAIDMVSNISKWSSTIRISFAETANNWKYTTVGDKGTHIQLIVKVVDSSLTAIPRIEFNDIALTNNSQYKVTGSNGNWTYYVDFDITETMISNRNGTPYDTDYRFIDLESVKSSTTVTVSLATKGGKKYYNNAGSSTWNYDKTNNTTLYAKWTPNNYTVTYNSNNLTYGLENKNEVTSGNVKYKVNNGVITVTANKDDGYGFVNVRAYLEAGKEYIFSCTTNGTWGSGNDTVEAFLMLEGQYNTYYRMGSNNGHKFTPTVTGEYWLRLDVNKTGKTYTFSNINISTNISNKTVTYNSIYDPLPTTSRSGYTFNGWYTAASGGTKLSNTTKVTTAGNHTVYAQWTVNSTTITYDYQNNIYNHNTSDWTFNGSSKVNTSYKYNNTPGFEVYSNTSQYTGIRIPINSDKKKNTNYKLSLYAYRTGSFSGNLRAYATTYNSSNTVLSYNHKINISTSNLTANKWTNYTGTFNTGSYSKWDNIYIDYDQANQGPVYVSNIRLDEYSTVTKNFGLQLGTLPTPKRSGYTFGGWYTGINGTGTKISSETTTPASNITYYAKWTTNNYTVTYNTNNLIYGLENVGQTTTSRVNYSVNNGTVTMKALVNDGYEYVGGRAYLEAGKTYYFSGTSGGTWGSDVEAFVMLNQSTATGDFVTITSLPYSSTDKAYPFTVQKTGEYWLRLDVNTAGKTYTFSNITISNKVSTSNVTFGSTYGTQPTTSRIGHSFNGWYTAASGGKKVTSSTIVQTASNHTLYAQWTTDNHTVTYNYSANGGTSATKTSATVSYGNSIDLKPTATKNGWTFVGWNTNKDATSGLSSLKMSSSNVTLYAIYRKEAITYTATTRSNVSGATGSNKTLTCTIAAVYNNSTQGTSCEVTLPSNHYTLSGWTFNGWVTTASNVTTTTNTSGTAAGNKITLTKNVNIVATWKKSATANFYYYNGSAQANATVTCTMYNGASSCNYTVPSAVTSSSGPSSTTYKGVSTSKSSTSTTSSYTSANSNYYAVYQKSITATFYYSGLTSDSYTYTTTAKTTTSSGTRTATTNGTSYSVNNPQISVPSAVTSSTGGAAAQTYRGVSNGINSVSTMTPTTAYTNYYAVYTENLDFYYYNGSSHTKTSRTRRMLYNGSNYTITLDGNIPSPSTYNNAAFTAWSYTSGSPNSDYYSEPLKTGVNALYAVYKKTVTLTYNANGGTGAPSSQSGTLYYTNTASNTLAQTNPTITLSSTKPTKTGSNFSGWTIKPNGSGTICNPGSSYTLSADTTLYAKWTVNTYTYNIVYNSSSGKQLGTGTVTYQYGTTNTISPKTFTGYTIPASQSIAWDSTTAKTITFTYTPISYTISYTLNGGSVSDNPTTYNVETNTITLNNPTKKGYTFEGWTGSNGTTKQKEVSIAKGSTGNKTYTANWTPISYTIKYNANGGDGSTASSKHTYDVSKKLTKNGFSNDGWYFAGWSWNGSTYTDQQSVKNLTTGNGNVLTFKAIWKTNGGLCSYCTKDSDCTGSYFIPETENHPEFSGKYTCIYQNGLEEKRCAYYHPYMQEDQLC